MDFDQKPFFDAGKQFSPLKNQTSKKPLKITCVLTSYNRPQNVIRAIASVKAQTYPNWELIIVDDNSNEQTQSILKEAVKGDKRLTLIQSNVKKQDRHKTTRYATCINMAIPLITGDLVTYLTDDDLFYPERFEKMEKVFRENPHIYVLYGKQKVIVSSKNKLERSFIRPQPGVTRFPMGRVDHNSFMHRTTCFELVKGWDDDPAFWKTGDAAFFRRLVKHWDFHPLNFLTDVHYIHDKGVQRRLSRGINPWDEDEAE